MRHQVEVVEVNDEFPGHTARGTVSSAKRPRLELSSFLATISLLLLAAPTALAQTPRSIELHGIAPPAAMALVALSAEIPREIPNEVAAPPPVVDPPIALELSEAQSSILEALLTLRSRTMHLPPARTTDELIAAAVALGNSPDLEPRNPFRKHSRDLFRTERPVTIGQTDMVVRLRLRAKARRAVSVEFRY